ncbi:GNAT family N-acetyltransferase [Pseudomonas citronellolis]|uniref:GNAT family N-acetyltransferase n=1 Tax=Pseudomonas citronellolis TaxID=53408 RepID=UPI0023E37BB2|nr:GNAT family N-acetyltransferase [Pseudomonas citronellolis]MDF3934473.1 GNAT family N-acetyltransferase [Pseudomonas citronellolis]
MPTSPPEYRLTTRDAWLVRPSLELCAPLRRALLDSYAEHAPFLDWVTPQVSAEQVLRSLRGAIANYAAPLAEKRLFLVSADRAEVIGCIGLQPRGRGDSYVIGYWANSRFAGQGYLSAALRDLCTQLPRATLYLTTSSANTRSQRLAEAAGFRLIRSLRGVREDAWHGLQDTLIYRRDVARAENGNSPRA